MIQWAPVAFVRLTIYLITGIVAATFFPVISASAAVTAFIVVLLAYSVCIAWLRTAGKGRRFRTGMGLLAASLITLSGYMLTLQRTEIRNPNHIVHLPEIAYYRGTITSDVQVKAKSYRVEIAVDRVYTHGRWKNASGTVLAYVRNDALEPRYGDQWIVRGTPQPVPPPANPDEFDYRQYLARQQIYHQQFMGKRDFVRLGNAPPNRVIAASLRVRWWANATFQRLIPSRAEYAIASGLVLGIKDGLDNEIKRAYANAGAMHVLAVSGTHVVLVFQILVWSLGRIKRLKYGNWLFAVIALVLLWSYAFVTGLSASVLRAVAMFSLVVIAEAGKRRTNPYNTLAVSAFGLLCVNPYWLLDVGFQLSYAAVLGIVYFYPKFYRAWEIDAWAGDKLWAMTCMSLAAQLATLPISLFYFHQFPTYALLVNPVVITLSGFVLQFGLLTLAVAWIPYASIAVAFVLKWIIWLLNQSVLLTERIPGAVIDGISVSLPETIGLYAILSCMLLFLYYRKLSYWALACSIVCVLVGFRLWEKVNQHTQHELAIYSVNRHAALGITAGSRQWLLTDSALRTDLSSLHFHLANHWIDQGITQSRQVTFNDASLPDVAVRKMNQFSLLVWRSKRFVLLHQPLPYGYSFPAGLRADYLVVQHNALFVRQIPSIAGMFDCLILDASNKPYRIRQLKEAALRAGMRCHAMPNDGAFVLQK